MSDAPAPEEARSDAPALDPAQATYLRQRLESEQNLLLAVLAGLGASLVGAGLWAGITVATGYQIGFMAIGVGFLVGFGVRFAGKGVTSTYGVVGAAFALLGCALGNLLAVVAIVAGLEGVAFLDALSQLDAGLAQQLMTASFSPMDLLFYGIAIYEGYHLAFRQVGEEDLQQILSGGAAG